jgi:hypothetical protein
MPFPKGAKLSPEHCKAISEGRKRKMAELGYLNSAEARSRMSQAKKGISLGAEHKANISNAKKGKTPANHKQALAAAHAMPKKTGEANPNWLGDAVGYSGLHVWIRKQRGTPSVCEECGDTNAKRYEWANISGDYLRDISDFRRLCVSCHRREGYEKGEYTRPSLRVEIKET